MAVAGLVLGILGITVFWWAGPALGVLFMGGSSVSQALQGQIEVSTTPIWATGLIVGVGLPLVSVGLCIAGLQKDQNKGVSIAGLVLGAVAAILGLIFTFVGVAGTEITKAAIGQEGLQQSADQLDDVQNTLNDPTFQKQIQEAMKRAQEMQNTQKPAPAPAAQPAQGAEAEPPPGAEPEKSSSAPPQAEPTGQPAGNSL